MIIFNPIRCPCRSHCAINHTSFLVAAYPIKSRLNATIRSLLEQMKPPIQLEKSKFILNAKEQKSRFLQAKLRQENVMQTHLFVPLWHTIICINCAILTLHGGIRTTQKTSKWCLHRSSSEMLYLSILALNKSM